jgi:hypothetical protein
MVQIEKGIIMNKISLSINDIEKCDEFSKNVDTSFYIKRNQIDSSKRISDSFLGKIGELTVYYSLVEKYPDISYPDFKIYKPREKSWDYDIKSSNFNLHVKSARENSKFPESWMFQSQDKHIFLNYLPKDYVAFVKVNLQLKSAEVRAILPVTLLHEKQLFKAPVLAKLFDKRAVYFEDLKEYDLFQL